MRRFSTSMVAAVPFGFLRWMRLTRLCGLSHFSFAWLAIGGIGPDVGGGVVVRHDVAQESRPSKRARICDLHITDEAEGPAIEMLLL